MRKHGRKALTCPTTFGTWCAAKYLRKHRLIFSRPAHELSFEQRRQNLQAWAQSHAGNTVVLADEDMERESIYGDHGR